MSNKDFHHYENMLFFKLFLVFLIIFSTKFGIIATIKGWFQSMHPGVDKSKYVVVTDES